MILIVDDDSNMAENCSMFLESCGYDVNVAFSGADALSQIKERRPDLLISDCFMPDMTGLHLSEQLKSGSHESQFPILLMSGSLQCEVAPGMTYDGFIKKPFLAENLLIEVKKLLNDNASLSGEISRAPK